MALLSLLAAPPVSPPHADLLPSGNVMAWAWDAYDAEHDRSSASVDP